MGPPPHPGFRGSDTNDRSKSSGRSRSGIVGGDTRDERGGEGERVRGVTVQLKTLMSRLVR